MADHGPTWHVAAQTLSLVVHRRISAPFGWRLSSTDTYHGAPRPRCVCLVLRERSWALQKKPPHFLYMLLEVQVPLSESVRNSLLGDDGAGKASQDSLSEAREEVRLFIRSTLTETKPEQAR
jgi:hypothetical protein